GSALSGEALHSLDQGFGVVRGEGDTEDVADRLGDLLRGEVAVVDGAVGVFLGEGGVHQPAAYRGVGVLDHQAAGERGPGRGGQVVAEDRVVGAVPRVLGEAVEVVPGVAGSGGEAPDPVALVGQAVGPVVLGDLAHRGAQRDRVERAAATEAGVGEQDARGGPDGERHVGGGAQPSTDPYSGGVPGDLQADPLQGRGEQQPVLVAVAAAAAA